MVFRQVFVKPVGFLILVVTAVESLRVVVGVLVI